MFLPQLAVLGSGPSRLAEAPNALALPIFWVSIRSYKKQPMEKNWGRMLGLPCLAQICCGVPVAVCPVALVLAGAVDMYMHHEPFKRITLAFNFSCFNRPTAVIIIRFYKYFDSIVF